MPVTASILLPENFSFGECLWYLNRNYDDCMHGVGADSFTKLLSVNDKPALFKLTEAHKEIKIELLHGNETQLPGIREYVMCLLDIERDLTTFYQLLEQDEDLSFMPNKYKGLRLIGIPDLFEALSWSIIGQQINLTFAYRLKRRLVEEYGQSLQFEDRKYYLFPLPEVLAEAQSDQLKMMQFSSRKAEYLINLAGLFASGKVSRESLADKSHIQIFQELVQIRGIGEWTAHYTMMKSFRTMHNITYGDSGLNKALHVLKGFDKKPLRSDIDSLFEKFDGWQSYLVFYLWRSLS
jgi:DNA-3-methyladenine glycosylase II